MVGIEWLKPAAFLGSILYALIGVVIFWVCFIVVDKITPMTCGAKSWKSRTRPWAWWWPPCAWASASSWRQRSIDVSLARRPVRCVASMCRFGKLLNNNCSHLH